MTNNNEQVKLITSNIILYCKKWEETAHFYKKQLCLEVLFDTDWFIEFSLITNSRLSIADEKRSSIKSSSQKGITITLQVNNIEVVWNDFKKRDLKPTAISKHPWDAKHFYIFDPEGHRIEIWESVRC